MITNEISKLGVIFTYDSNQNVLLLTIPRAHVLPRSEAERVWQLVRTYAASYPTRPELVLEVGGQRLEYGKVEPSFHHFSHEYSPDERRCLSLMAHSTAPFYELAPLAFV